MAKRLVKASIVSTLLVTMIIGNSFALNKHSSAKKTAADTNNLNPTPIGTFFTYQRVTAHTKVVIPFSEVEFIESTGRMVYSEWVPGGGSIPMGQEEPRGMVPINDPDYIDHPVLQFYYWAETYNGIITGSEELDNSIDSLEIILNQLELDTDFYLVNYLHISPSSYDDYVFKKNNLILYYIRSSNPNYIGGNWDLMMGPQYTSFKSFIDSIEPFTNNTGTDGKITLLEYFSFFLSPATSNHFIDPIGPSVTMDLLHCFASIDGTILDTERDDIFESSINLKYIRHVASWGGDLQTVCSIVGDDGINFTTMTQVFSNISVIPDVSNINYGFDWEDFISDMEAINIAANFDSYEENICSSALYYFNNENINLRMPNMVRSMADISNISHQHLDHLRGTIYNMLALSNDGNWDIWTSFDALSGKYDLLLYHGEPPSRLSRKNIADLFYRYLMEGY